MPLSPAEKKDLKVHFDSFDHDGNGTISLSELGEVVKRIGETATPDQLKKYMAEVDKDASGTIDFDEFCEFFDKLKSGKASATSGFGNVFTKNSVNVVQSQHAQHSFSDEEKEGFVSYINDCIASDPEVKYLGFPLNPKGMDIFNAVKDGVLLCKLINFCVKGTIDERAINKPTKAPLNAFKITENNNLVINSAKAIGCQVVNVGAPDLAEGKVHLVLGLLWQIIRIGLLSSINLKNHPYLIRLLEPGETLEDLLKLSPEQILLRWFNYHLKNAGSNKRVHNFTSDIKDSEAYTILLNQLDPKKCDKKALTVSDPNQRAELVLQNADKLNCRKFLRPQDIVKGNGKLNLAFVANLFNTCPGLEAVQETFEEVEETREEKAFRSWMNSLGVDPFVNYLYEDLRDGIILLQILDKISPGIVDWKRVNTKKPISKFQQIENCNYALDLGKKLGFSLVGIGGQDINAGNKTLTLAIVWQCMRFYVLNYLKNMSKGGKEIREDDIVQWANGKVASSGKDTKIGDFKDKRLADSVFIFDLLDACQKNSVDFNLVFNPAYSSEDRQKNAQYAISCARKMGCAVFLLWEDIVEVKPKLLMCFFASIMSVFGF